MMSPYTESHISDMKTVHRVPRELVVDLGLEPS